MKILIVEDEIIPANYLKKMLEEEGYEVLDIVDKGKDAIHAARRENPQIILMDVMLKDNISGCDAALEISRHSPEILIIFLTAFSDKEMIDFAVESKAFGYLLKPYRDKEILATLTLAKSKLEQNNFEKNISTETKYIFLTDGYFFDTRNQVLRHKTKEVLCGPKALELIALLCKHKGNTVKIDYLLETLWSSDTSQQTLRSLIHRIREQTSQGIIGNINKLGYKISLNTKSKKHNQ